MGIHRLTKVLFLVAICSLSVAFSVMAQSPVDVGGALGTQAMGRYGSRDGLRTNLFNPLMSGSAPLETLDGSAQGDARLLCPSSSRFMDIFVQPGPSGDIQTLLVSQDTDFDGVLDYSYQAPFLVSGVCANGIISCDAGLWSHCTTYRWVADGSGRASLQETLINNLAGCFCINNSCGSNLAFNDMAIKTIGGGIVAAVHQQNSRYVVSDVKVDGMVAQYFGQDSARCNTVEASSIDAEKYFFDPSSLRADVDAAVTGQTGDPESLYSLLANTGQTVNAEVKSCSATRVFYMHWTDEGDCAPSEYIDDRCFDLENDPGCSLRDEYVDGVRTFERFNPTGLIPVPGTRDIIETKRASCDYSCPGSINAPCLGDPPTCVIGGVNQHCTISRPIGNISMTCNSGLRGDADGSNVLRLNCATIEFMPGLSVTGGGYTTPYSEDGAPCPGGTAWAVNYEDRACFGWPCVSLCVSDLKISSLYGFRGSNPNPTVGGFRTYSVSQQAGNTLIINSRIAHCSKPHHQEDTMAAWVFSVNHCPLRGTTGTVSGCSGNPSECAKTCTGQAMRDWWKKDRTYVCTTSGYDFGDAKQRLSSIKESVTDTTSSLYYRDYRENDDGEWIYEDRTHDMTGAYRPVVDTCQKACKTRKQVEDTETNVTAMKGDYLESTTSYSFFYRQCNSAGCPLGEGEEVVLDCQCINEFAEAAVIMQSLRQAGKDMICSSGEKGALR